MRRTVVVTGASRGIGAAIARRLAKDGWSVAAAARSAGDLEALCGELRDTGVAALAVALDVADPASIDRAAHEVRRFAGEAGPVEAVVNNAGVAVSAPLLPRPPERDGGDDLFERHMDVNFHGARRVAEAFLPDMLGAGRGAIVNVASSAGLRGYAYVAAYCASKHALVGWTRAAAAELAAKGVRVHAVCPHYVDSPMLDRSIACLVEKTGRTEAEARAFFAAENPGGRLVTPGEVADAVAELLDARDTGRILELTGGAAVARDVHDG
jgi:NAD(P)-dependent dehydrogenase (short-subunit alcohol dehydrogenase family)